MSTILFLILFIILLIIGGKRGIKTFFTFLMCMLLIIIYILLMNFGFNAIIISFIICTIASIISLFFLNGLHVKTISAFIAVIIVEIISFIIIYIITKRANIGCFGTESLETISAFNQSINYDMSNLIIGLYLVSIVGTLIDTSISVATSMNEIYENNPSINEKELYISGMNVGKDILSTTINTLFFALISVFIGFFMFFKGMPVEQIINYKSFANDIIRLLIAFISSIIIIPVSAFTSSKLLLNNKIKKELIKIRKKISSAFSQI